MPQDPRLDFYNANKPEPYKPVTGYKAPVTAGLPDLTFKMNDTPESYTPYIADGEYVGNIDALRAERQWGTMKLFNGALNRAASIVPKVAQGFGHAGGFIYDIGGNIYDAAQGNDLRGIKNTFDNPLVNAMSEADEHLKKVLPVYNRDIYNNGTLFESMNTTEFWANDIFDGAAFMLSSLVGGGAVSKGAGALLNATKGVSKVGQQLTKALGKSDFGYDDLTKSLAKGVIDEDTFNTGVKLLNGIQNNKSMSYSAFSTISEAGTEAHGIAKQIKEQLAAKKGKKYEELTPAEKSEIDTKAGIAGANTFRGNMIALALPNYLEGKMLYGNPKNIANDVFGKINKGLIDKAELTKLATAKSGSAISKKGLSNVGTSFLREGFWEENIQKSMEDYETKSVLNGDNLRENMDLASYVYDMVKGYSKEAMTGISALAKSPFQDLTREEIEKAKAIMLGGIISTIPSYMSGRTEDMRDADKNKKLYDAGAKYIDAMQKIHDRFGENIRTTYKTKKNAEGVEEVELDADGNAVEDFNKASQLVKNTLYNKALYDETLVQDMKGDDLAGQFTRDIAFARSIFNLYKDSVTTQDDLGVENSTEGAKEYIKSKLELLARDAQDPIVAENIKKRIATIDSIIEKIENSPAFIFTDEEERTGFANQVRTNMFYEQVKQESLGKYIPKDINVLSSFTKVIDDSKNRIKQLTDNRQRESLFEVYLQEQANQGLQSKYELNKSKRSNPSNQKVYIAKDTQEQLTVKDGKYYNSEDVEVSPDNVETLNLKDIQAQERAENEAMRLIGSKLDTLPDASTLKRVDGKYVDESGRELDPKFIKTTENATDEEANLPFTKREEEANALEEEINNTVIPDRRKRISQLAGILDKFNNAYNGDIELFNDEERDILKDNNVTSESIQEEIPRLMKELEDGVEEAEKQDKADKEARLAALRVKAKEQFETKLTIDSYTAIYNQINKAKQDVEENVNELNELYDIWEDLKLYGRTPNTSAFAILYDEIYRVSGNRSMVQDERTRIGDIYAKNLELLEFDNESQIISFINTNELHVLPNIAAEIREKFNSGNRLLELETTIAQTQSDYEIKMDSFFISQNPNYDDEYGIEENDMTAFKDSMMSDTVDPAVKAKYDIIAGLNKTVIDLKHQLDDAKEFKATLVKFDNRKPKSIQELKLELAENFEINKSNVPKLTETYIVKFNVKSEEEFTDESGEGILRLNQFKIQRAVFTHPSKSGKEYNDYRNYLDETIATLERIVAIAAKNSNITDIVQNQAVENLNINAQNNIGIGYNGEVINPDVNALIRKYVPADVYEKHMTVMAKYKANGYTAIYLMLDTLKENKQFVEELRTLIASKAESKKETLLGTYKSKFATIFLRNPRRSFNSILTEIENDNGAKGKEFSTTYNYNKTYNLSKLIEDVNNSQFTGEKAKATLLSLIDFYQSAQGEMALLDYMESDLTYADLIEIESLRFNNTEVKYPSAQQSLAIRELMVFYNKVASTNDPLERIAYMKGNAGTGKTTLICNTFIDLLGLNRSTEVLAFANNDNTSAKVNLEIETGRNTTVETFIKEPLNPEIKLIIIDEISGVTTNQLLAIKEKIKLTPEVKVIVIGDPSQVIADLVSPPIEDYTNYKATAITPITVVFRTDVAEITQFAELFLDTSVTHKNLTPKYKGEGEFIGVESSESTTDLVTKVKESIAKYPDKTRLIIVNTKDDISRYRELLDLGVLVLSYDKAVGQTVDHVFLDINFKGKSTKGTPFESQYTDNAKEYNTAMYTSIARATEYAFIVDATGIIGKAEEDPTMEIKAKLNGDRFNQLKNNYINRLIEENKIKAELGLESVEMTLSEPTEQVETETQTETETGEDSGIKSTKEEPVTPVQPVEHVKETKKDITKVLQEKLLTEMAEEEAERNALYFPPTVEEKETVTDADLYPIPDVQDGEEFHIIKNVEKDSTGFYDGRSINSNKAIKVGKDAFYVREVQDDVVTYIIVSPVKGNQYKKLGVVTEATDKAMFNKLENLAKANPKTIVVNNYNPTTNNYTIVGVEAATLLKGKVAFVKPLTYNYNEESSGNMLQDLKEKLISVFFPTKERRQVFEDTLSPVTVKIFKDSDKSAEFKGTLKKGIPYLMFAINVGNGFATWTRSQYVRLNPRKLNTKDRHIQDLIPFTKALDEIYTYFQGRGIENHVINKYLKAFKHNYEITTKEAGSADKQVSRKSTILTYEQFLEATNVKTDKGIDINPFDQFTEDDYNAISNMVDPVVMGYYGYDRVLKKMSPLQFMNNMATEDQTKLLEEITAYVMKIKSEEADINKLMADVMVLLDNKQFFSLKTPKFTIGDTTLTLAQSEQFRNELISIFKGKLKYADSTGKKFHTLTTTGSIKLTDENGNPFKVYKADEDVFVNMNYEHEDGLAGGKGPAQNAFNLIAQANNFVGEKSIRVTRAVKKGGQPIKYLSGKSLLAERGDPDNLGKNYWKSIREIITKNLKKEAIDEFDKSTGQLNFSFDKYQDELEYAMLQNGWITITQLNAIKRAHNQEMINIQDLKNITESSDENGDHKIGDTYLRLPLNLEEVNTLGKDLTNPGNLAKLNSMLDNKLAEITPSTIHIQFPKTTSLADKKKQKEEAKKEAEPIVTPEPVVDTTPTEPEVGPVTDIVDTPVIEERPDTVQPVEPEVEVKEDVKPKIEKEAVVKKSRNVKVGNITSIIGKALQGKISLTADNNKALQQTQVELNKVDTANKQAAINKRRADALKAQAEQKALEEFEAGVLSKQEEQGLINKDEKLIFLNQDLNAIKAELDDQSTTDKRRDKLYSDFQDIQNAINARILQLKCK